MITNKNILFIFKELDNGLAKKNLIREFTIFGSSALLIQNIASENRASFLELKKSLGVL